MFVWKIVTLYREVQCSVLIPTAKESEKEKRKKKESETKETATEDWDASHHNLLRARMDYCLPSN